jgi:hypothetical protein
MSEDKEGERLGRLKARAIIKRSSVISIIRSINSLAARTSTEPELIPEFISAVLDLDTLWAQFKSEDESVLDYLIGMNKKDDYSSGLIRIRIYSILLYHTYCTYIILVISIKFSRLECP